MDVEYNFHFSLTLIALMISRFNGGFTLHVAVVALAHDGEKLVKTVRFLIKQSDFQLIQKLVKSQCLHLITQ